MRDIRRYEVWGASMELALMVYDLTRGFPLDERFGLTAQIRRAAVSVGSNLAEGAGRWSPQDFSRFVGMAIGSTNELEFQLVLAQRLGYLTESDSAGGLILLRRVRAMLVRLRQSLMS